MTAQMMARDAAAMIAMTTYRPAPAVASAPVIARLDRTEADIRCDRDQDGLRRSRQDLVGGEAVICQVATLGGDTLIRFWDAESDGH